MGNVLSFGVWGLVCLILVVSSGALVVADSGNLDLNWKALFPGAPLPTNPDPIIKAQNISTISTISVCSSGCDYSHIQDAINASKDFDIIKVEWGIYPESLTINKSVSIQGMVLFLSAIQSRTTPL